MPAFDRLRLTLVERAPALKFGVTLSLSKGDATARGAGVTARAEALR